MNRRELFEKASAITAAGFTVGMSLEAGAGFCGSVERDAAESDALRSAAARSSICGLNDLA